MQPHRPRLPSPPLLRLLVLVLLLHALVLWGLPTLRSWPTRPAPPSLHTRWVALAPVPPAPPSAPAAAAPAPKTAPEAPRRRPRTTDAPAPAPVPAADDDTPLWEPASGQELGTPMVEPEPEPTPATALAQAHAAAPSAAASAAHDDAPQAQASAAAAVPASAAQASASAASAPATAIAHDPGLAIQAPSDAGPSLADGTTASAAPPVQVPPPMRLAFDVSGEVKGFRYSASAQWLFRHDGAQYEARQEVKAFLIGSRAQTSVGRLTAWGLQPRRFGDRVRSEQAAHFDFEAGQVTFSANTPSAPIAPGAQDRLSVFIELAALLAAAPERYPEGTLIALTTASARATSRWVFRVGPLETLELPAGPLPAIALQRVPQDVYDQRAELWLAPSLHYLPVRLRITQSQGDFVELQLKNSATLPLGLGGEAP